MPHTGPAPPLTSPHPPSTEPSVQCRCGVMLPGYHPYQLSHENNMPLCLARWHRHLKEQAVQRAAAMIADQAQAELDAGSVFYTNPNHAL